MDIKALTKAMNQFVESKGWYSPGSPHPQTPRNVAISLALESAEVLEHFQWKAIPEETVADELADVALYLLQLASLLNIDLEEALLRKLELNRNRDWDSIPRAGQPE